MTALLVTALIAGPTGLLLCTSVVRRASTKLSHFTWSQPVSGDWREKIKAAKKEERRAAKKAAKAGAKAGTPAAVAPAEPSDLDALSDSLPRGYALAVLCKSNCLLIQ